MGPETVNNQPLQADSKPNAVVLKALETLLEEKFPNCSFNYVIEKASGKGDNYLGLVYRIIAQISGAEQDGEQTFQLIIKTPPESEMQRKNFVALASFNHEATAYSELLPMMIDFQKSKGLVEGEIFQSFPKCYKVMTEDKNEAIFLEDLSPKGFRMFDRFNIIDEEHVASVMRSLGKLHAVSFAMKDQVPEKLSKYMELRDIFRKEEIEMFGPYFEGLKERSINSLDDVTDHEYKEKYIKYVKDRDIFDQFVNLLNGKLTKDQAVVCHGDSWNNNILFHYNEQDKPTEASIIDWQLIRFASPFTDIFYYIFSSTRQKFRKENFKNMMNIYYESLAAHIKRLGSDPERMFSRDVFDENLQKFGSVGLIFALMIIPVIVILPQDVVDAEKMARLMEAKKNKEVEHAVLEDLLFAGDGAKDYATRMREIIIDVIDFGFLDE